MKSFQLVTGAEEIFSVETNEAHGQTLAKAKFDAKFAAKRQIFNDINTFEMKIPLDEKDWLQYFR